MRGRRVGSEHTTELHARESGHDQVGDDDVGRGGHREFEGGLGVDGFCDVVSLRPQPLPEQLSYVRTVIDDEYAQHGLAPLGPMYLRTVQIVFA